LTARSPSAPRPGEFAALLALPIAFLIVQWLMRDHALPYWLGINFDPAYAYLPSGLMVLEGVPPALFQHPGTPVEALLALVAWATGFGAPGHVSDAAFAHGEFILRATSDVIMVLEAIGLVALGWIARRRLGALLPAWLAQAAPFMSVLGLKHGIAPKPEPMLLLAVVLLSAAMIEEWHRPRRATLVAMALVVGFGVACKITFAPIGLAPLILMPQWNRRIGYALLSLLFFALWISPAWSEFASMGGWYGAIATHSGAYGSGEVQMLDPGRYLAGFVKLFFSRPLYLIVYGAGLAMLAMRWRERRAQAAPMSLGERAVLAALVAQLAQMLVAAKQPSAHYVLPSLEWAGPTAAFVWIVAREVRGLDRFHAGVRGAFAGFLVLTLVAQAFGAHRVDGELRAQSALSLSIDMEKAFPGCAHFYRNLASSPSEAWFHNMKFGAAHFARRLAPLIPPDDYFMIPWRDPDIHSWTGTVTTAELAARYSCVALRGIESGALQNIGAALGSGFDRGATCALGDETIVLRATEEAMTRIGALPPACVPDKQ
jgi:hypothetical protein